MVNLVRVMDSNDNRAGTVLAPSCLTSMFKGSYGYQHGLADGINVEVQKQLPPMSQLFLVSPSLPHVRYSWDIFASTNGHPNLTFCLRKAPTKSSRCGWTHEYK